MGGTTEPIVAALKDTYRSGLGLADAVRIAVDALTAGPTSPATAGAEPEKKVLEVSALEVAVLDQGRPRRAFRRIAGAALADMLPASAPSATGDGSSEPETPQ